MIWRYLLMVGALMSVGCATNESPGEGLVVLFDTQSVTRFEGPEHGQFPWDSHDFCEPEQLKDYKPKEAFDVRDECIVFFSHYWPEWVEGDYMATTVRRYYETEFFPETPANLNAISVSNAFVGSVLQHAVVDEDVLAIVKFWEGRAYLIDKARIFTDYELELINGENRRISQIAYIVDFGLIAELGLDELRRSIPEPPSQDSCYYDDQWMEEDEDYGPLGDIFEEKWCFTQGVFLEDIPEGHFIRIENL